MGGGNGAKSAAKRAKVQAKLAKEGKKKGSQLDAQKSQPMTTCKKCYTQFPQTTRELELRTHCDNKHKEFGFEQAFPDWGKKEEKKSS